MIAADPTRWEGYVLRGAALERLKRVDEAEPDYKKALELEPEKPELVRTLAAATTCARAIARRRTALSPKLVETDPTAANHLLYGVFLALDRSRDADAEAAYEKALEVATDENQGEVVQRVASYYYARERYDEAEKTLKDGLEARTDDLDLIYCARPLLQLARRQGEGRRDDRAGHQRQAQRREAVPDPVGVSRSATGISSRCARRGGEGDRGRARGSDGEAAQGRAAGRHGRQRRLEGTSRPGTRDRRRRAGEVAGRCPRRTSFAPSSTSPQRKADDAVASLRRALDRRADWAQAHFLLASALLMQNDRQQARAEVLRAIELDAEFIEARRLLTKLHALLGEHDLAIEEARRVLRQRPDDKRCASRWRRAWCSSNKPDEARQELDTIPLDQRDARN